MQGCWEPGQLVVSTAGRDKGNYYIILRRIDHRQVFVVDGRMRKVAKPKCKNCKHLKAFPEKSLTIHEKITNGIKITDLDVQRAIQELVVDNNKTVEDKEKS